MAVGGGAPRVFCLADPAGVLIYINDAGRRLFGLKTVGPPLEATIFDLLTDEDGRRVKEALAVLAAGGEVPPLTVVARGKNGGTFPVLTYLHWLPPEGGEKGRVCVLMIERAAQDRHERRLLQEARMEAVSTLAGGVAHEFNNLLTAVQGNVSLMMADLHRGHPHWERLRVIEEQVRQGAELTKQLLGFARSGQYLLVPTDLNVLVQQTAAMFGRSRKGLEIKTVLDPRLEAVSVDRDQIQQVFLQILTNAAYAMPAGGRVTIETRDVIIDPFVDLPFEVTPGRYAKVSITDEGMGMDEKTRERIFEPFFTTRGMGRGTGLGLASAYGIIKGHGGFVQVGGDTPRGTRFDIYLPASREAVLEPEPQPETIAEAEESSGTILVVDDEKAVLDVTQELLELMGYRVLTAGGGREAVEIYEKKKDEVDLVILDMVMPDMDGGETFDCLKAIDPAVRVVLYSGFSVSEKARTLIEKGCIAFVQKPFQVNEFVRVVTESIGKRV
ncbi:MAG TPA: response regulator [Syntrophales bacterium]|nr:response regulator [Syntrophales bacterium]